MIANDLTRFNSISGVKIPKLKGHVKLTLHNCRTGKNETYEGSNVISNAVRDIFLANHLGAINTGSLLPIWSKWYGGVLCYQNPHPVPSGSEEPDPDAYFVQGNDINPLIAHAGDVAPQDLADDLTRGMPNTAVRVITDTAVKQGWEWGTTQGNGIISALSLTHKDTGNCGLGSNSNAFAAFEPFASIGNLASVSPQINSADNLFTKYDENHGLWFHIGDVDEFYNQHTNFETKKLTVIIRRLPFEKVGLFETMNADATNQRVFVVELTNNLYLQPAFYFDYENKKLWVFNNVTSVMSSSESYSNTTVNYAVIDCESEEVDSEGTIVSDTSNLAPLSMIHIQQSGFVNRFINANIIKEGNYVYFPTTAGVNWGSASTNDFGQNVNGYKKINIVNQAEQSSISFNTAQTHFRSSIKNGGLILTGGRVVNGGVGYSCANTYLTDFSESAPSRTFTGVWGFGTPDKISSYATPIGTGDYSSPTSLNRYILVNKMVNTTLFNLPTAVQKTSTQSMTVEYTIREVSDDE